MNENAASCQETDPGDELLARAVLQYLGSRPTRPSSRAPAQKMNPLFCMVCDASTDVPVLGKFPGSNHGKSRPLRA